MLSPLSARGERASSAINPVQRLTFYAVIHCVQSFFAVSFLVTSSSRLFAEVSFPIFFVAYSAQGQLSAHGASHHHPRGLSNLHRYGACCTSAHRSRARTPYARTPYARTGLHDACQQLASRSVSVLAVDSPESDWARWNTEVRAVVASYGPDFTAALDHAGNIPAAVVPGVLADEPMTVTAPQLRQHALYAFISNSLDVKDQPGTARRLIAELQHGGGQIGGVAQAYPALRDRYETAEVPEDPSAQMQQLLHPSWPRKLSRELLQAHLRNQQRLAEELHMSPAGNTASEQG